MTTLQEINELIDEVTSGTKQINNRTYLGNYIIDKYFQFVDKNWREIRRPENLNRYKKLQNLVLDNILLEIIVGGGSRHLYNSMMTYNGSCTEERLQRYFAPLGMRYNVNDDEHLCTHTGYGTDAADLVSDKPITFTVTDSAGVISKITAGPRYEVKDYKDLNSAHQRVRDEAGGRKFHDATHAFIHIIETDEFYLIANCKNTRWFKLVFETPLPYYRRQVKLWQDDNDPDKILCVKFR